jgi:hypothetical protein
LLSFLFSSKIVPISKNAVEREPTLKLLAQASTKFNVIVVLYVFNSFTIGLINSNSSFTVLKPYFSKFSFEQKT